MTEVCGLWLIVSNHATCLVTHNKQGAQVNIRICNFIQTPEYVLTVYLPEVCAMTRNSNNNNSNTRSSGK